MRRILDFQVEFFKRKGVSANGSTEYPPGTVVIGGAETVDFILERCAATGEAYLPEQVHGVIETQLATCGRSAPSGRPQAGRSGRAGISAAQLTASRGTSFGTRERRWSNTCMIVTGPWRCAAARPARQPYRWTACGIYRRTAVGRVGVGPPHEDRPADFQNDLKEGASALSIACPWAPARKVPFREPTGPLRGVPLPGRQAQAGRVRPRHRRCGRDARPIAELLASEQFAAFSPDTLAEARNRGYRPHASAWPADADSTDAALPFGRRIR